jgi:hypothetical protein
MADIVITIPNEVVDRVLDAFVATYFYNPDEDGTRAAFAKACVIKYIRKVVVDYESEQAARSAKQTAIITAETDIALS